MSELFGDDAPVVPAPRRRPKAKPAAAPADPRIQVAIDRWYEGYRAKHHMKPVAFNGGHAGRHFKAMLAVLDEADVHWCIDEFFRTREPRVTQSNYSFGVFSMHSTYLLQRRNGHALQDPKAAANYEAARAASTPRRYER